MTNVVLKVHMTLDGYVGTSSGEVHGINPTFDDEQKEWEVETLWRAGVHAMGAATYREMAGYWPSSTEPFAPPMNDIPKVVFSKTLESAGWGETTIVGGDVGGEIARLKRTLDKDVLVHGGARLAQSLGLLRLIDEYLLVVHPVVLGQGLPIFVDRFDLQLAGTSPFLGSAVLHTCRRA